MTEENQQDEQVIENPPPNPMDALSEVEVKRMVKGDTIVTLHQFSALDGWEIKHQYRAFLETTDQAFRMQFTVGVLSHASVRSFGEEMRLSGPQVINDQLESWQNVDAVFHAVLAYNGVRVDPAEVERRRWQVAGEDMAKAFLASVSDLMTPAMKLAAAGTEQDEGVPDAT